MRLISIAYGFIVRVISKTTVRVGERAIIILATIGRHHKCISYLRCVHSTIISVDARFVVTYEGNNVHLHKRVSWSEWEQHMGRVNWYFYHYYYYFSFDNFNMGRHLIKLIWSLVQVHKCHLASLQLEGELQWIFSLLD